ncbi:Antiviral helicase ski2, partial [Linderina pennispora]
MDEELFQTIEREYLLPQPSIRNPYLSSAQLSVDHKSTLHEVLSIPSASLGSTMTMVRDHVTGEYCAATETELSGEANPMSFMRKTGRKQNYASGSSNQVPFQPGGLDEKDLEASSGNVPAFDPAEFYTVPDGFDRGLFVVADVVVPEQAQPIDLAVERYGDAADEEPSSAKEAGDGVKDPENDELDQLVSNDDDAEQTADARARAAKKDGAAMARK